MARLRRSSPFIGGHSFSEPTLLPVHPRTRFPAGGWTRRDRVEDARIHRQHFVYRRVWFPGEQVAQIGSRGVVEIQRGNSQQSEDGLEQTGKAGIGVADVVRLDRKSAV